MKYPRLKGWLVYSNRLGQADLDLPVEQVVREISATFEAGESLRQAIEVQREINKKIKAASEAESRDDLKSSPIGRSADRSGAQSEKKDSDRQWDHGGGETAVAPCPFAMPT